MTRPLTMRVMRDQRPAALFAGLEGLRVGILGGSFNPAHDGHRHLSLIALRALKLDRVVWLVSPQNPLKASDGMATLDMRMARASAVANHPHILISDIEIALGTRYTVDTLAALKHRFARIHFVWLMGADNLVQFPKWERWTRIMDLVPVAVIDRPGDGIRAQLGKCATRYRDRRLADRDCSLLATANPPAWTYVHAKLHPLSASSIRNELPAGVSWTDGAL